MADLRRERSVFKDTKDVTNSSRAQTQLSEDSSSPLEHRKLDVSAIATTTTTTTPKRSLSCFCCFVLLTFCSKVVIMHLRDPP